MSWAQIKICLGVPAYSLGQSLLTKTKIKTNRQLCFGFVIKKKKIHLNVGWLDYGKH